MFLENSVGDRWSTDTHALVRGNERSFADYVALDNRLKQNVLDVEVVRRGVFNRSHNFAGRKTKGNLEGRGNERMELSRKSVCTSDYVYITQTESGISGNGKCVNIEPKPVE